MIKMIVSDVDGTLFDKGEEYISDELLNLIENLRKKGIVFAIASGRHLSELKRIFKNSRDIYYIASDGGCIEYNDNIIYYKPIDDYIIDKCKERDYIFQCSKYVYYGGNDQNIKNILENNYKEAFKNNYKTANIIKIVKYGCGYSESPSCTYEIYKDKEWREWIKNGVSKGKAVEFIQNRENVKVMETAAFGDNFNDISMMRVAGDKYCRKNSPAQVRMICKKFFDNIEDELFKIGGQYE